MNSVDHHTERRTRVVDPLARVDVLTISGPAGVGKTSVAFEVSMQLQRRDIPHAVIDTDELDRLYPVPDDQDALSEHNPGARGPAPSREGGGTVGALHPADLH